MLQETFVSNINKDISLEKATPCSWEDIEIIVAWSYFNNHWSIVLTDCIQRCICYLDPLNNYVQKYKIDSDIIVVIRNIWFHVLHKPYSEENIPLIISDWMIVQVKISNVFSIRSYQNKVIVGIVEWCVYSTFITLPTSQNLLLDNRKWEKSGNRPLIFYSLSTTHQNLQICT